MTLVTLLLKRVYFTREFVIQLAMLDILHTLYLGIFFRVRDAFFAQVGPTSQIANKLDVLAKDYGVLLERQSERDLPKSQFSKGIMGGKLMAKEYEGVLRLSVLD